MTREEFERIKEAEKEHLRKLKQLKQAARHLERQKRLNQAMGEIGGAYEALERHDQLVDDLTHETARHEARLDLALESAQARDDEKAQPYPAQEALEEEMTTLKAQQLLQQLKAEMAAAPQAAGPTSPQKPAPAPRSARPKTDAPDASAGTSSDTPMPEKTIGRMKP